MGCVCGGENRGETECVCGGGGGGEGIRAVTLRLSK